MSVFDIREPWVEGSLFMRNNEYETLMQVVGEERLIKLIINSCNIADNSINKMMGK